MTLRDLFITSMNRFDDKRLEFGKSKALVELIEYSSINHLIW